MVDRGSPVVFLMGPTASGKTDLASKLFDRFNVELISVDAAQVYRGMDIGTAKPECNFLAKYPHHLIDIRSPNHPYSAASFRDDALALIKSAHQSNKLPVLVGGTMFYFSALENGLSDLPPANHSIREEMAKELALNGVADLYTQLNQVDPVYAEKLHSTDTQRILRALEIYRLTGLPPSIAMLSSRTVPLGYPLIKMTLFTTDRYHLHQRISTRFDSMIENGLIEETRELIDVIEQPEQSPSLRIVGYRQVYEYLEKKISYQQMKEKGIAATRQLAKRQLTWLRQQSNLVWFASNSGDVSTSVSQYLTSHHLIRETMG